MLCLALLLSCGAFSQKQTRTPEQIRKEMSDVRENTDWGDEAAANKAQAKIEALAKELMMAGKAQQQQAAGMQVDSAKLEEEAEYKMSLWRQMMAAVDQGEEGDILLAKPLREKIVEEYKNDESPKIKNPQYFEEQTFLCIDMSVPTIQRIIEQMENFKSIKALLITCSKEPSNVDLEDLLSRAKNYPLEQLHIVNFKQYVTQLPDNLSEFTSLRELSLFNNEISELPHNIGSLTSLETLYLDINPLYTVMPMVTSLTHLKTMGLAKTRLSESEIEEIKSLLPDCKILIQ